MTEPENFLERWSRKKAESQREDAEAPDPSAAPDPAAGPSDAAEPDPIKASAPEGETPPSPSAATSESDLARLPSLESITAGTDIRPFLSAGVPQELTRAALRRAWLADPAIRDFVGLQENDWDFNNPAGVPGFGDMPPGYDIKKMIADIFGETKPPSQQANAAGETPPPPSEVPATPATGSKIAGEAEPASLTGASPSSGGTPAESSQAGFMPSDSDIAVQRREAEASSTETQRPRRHGGALPQS